MSFDRTKVPNVRFKFDGSSGNAHDFILGPYLRTLILSRGPISQYKREFGLDSDEIRISGHGIEKETDHKFIDARIVSRNHASLEWKFKSDCTVPKLYIKDLGSTHGTFVQYEGESGQLKLLPDQDYSLMNGDSIIIGRQVEKGGECHLPAIFHVSMDERLSNGEKASSVSVVNPISIDSDYESDIVEHSSESKIAQALNTTIDEAISDLSHSESEAEIIFNEDSYSEGSVNGSENENDLHNFSFDESHGESPNLSEQSYDHESEEESEEEEEEEDHSTDLTENSDQERDIAAIDVFKALGIHNLRPDSVGEIQSSTSQVSPFEEPKCTAPAGLENLSELEKDASKENHAEEHTSDVSAQEKGSENETKELKTGEPISVHDVREVPAEKEEVELAKDSSGPMTATNVSTTKDTLEETSGMTTKKVELSTFAKVFEAEGAVSKVDSVQVTTARSSKRKADEAELDTPQDEQSKNTSTPMPKRQNVGFRTGLAAGFVAGVVGTIIGLSSIPFSDSL